MENPLSKFVPFLVGEFPRSFKDLYKKVSQNEQINNENLEKELGPPAGFAKEVIPLLIAAGAAAKAPVLKMSFKSASSSVRPLVAAAAIN